MHKSSSYAKILGEKLFRTWEFPRSGSKSKDGEKRRRRRLNDGDNNGQATHGARKHAWRTQAAWAKKTVTWRPPGPTPVPGVFSSLLSLHAVLFTNLSHLILTELDGLCYI